MDHSFSDDTGPPVVFETYIDGPDCPPSENALTWDWEVMERYSTWEQAVQGHQRWVQQVEVAIASIIATGHRSWPPPSVVVPKVIIPEIIVNPEHSNLL